MKMMYEPANNWTISSSLAPALPRRDSALGPCGGDEVPEDLGDRLEDDHYDDQKLEDRLIARLVLTLGEV